MIKALAHHLASLGSPKPLQQDPPAIDNEWRFVMIGLTIYASYFVIILIWPRIFKFSSSNPAVSTSEQSITISKTLYEFLAKAEIRRKRNADEIIKLKMKLNICETKCKLLLMEKRELGNLTPPAKSTSNLLRDRAVMASSAATAEKSPGIFFGGSSSPAVSKSADIDDTLFAFDDDYVQENKEKPHHVSGHVSFDDLTGSDSGDEVPQDGVVSQIVNVLNPLSYFTSPMKPRRPDPVTSVN